MNCEVIAVGTELLLGPSVDSNAAWIGEKLAEFGINSHFHTVVGDNQARIVEAMRLSLSRADAVVITGGLGPTSDDITREALAEVMGSPLDLDPSLEVKLRAIFTARGREMSPSNLQQAYKPVGATAIDQISGTAPGLICPVGDKVMYSLPGVPSEMKEMFEGSVLPDIRSRAGQTGAIVSRFLRTWGVPESVLGEMVAPRVSALDAVGNPTIAFLAHGIEGIYVRVTAHGSDVASATALVDEEEAKLRELIGDLAFGIDDESMEYAVGELLKQHGFTLGLAESITGGLIAARLTSVAGASEWFRGGVVSYATEVKQSVLSVPDGPVVTAQAARDMAAGARSVIGSDIAIGITGVAGPTKQEDQPVGTVFAAIAMPDGSFEDIELHLSGDRKRIRDFACINVLDALRKRLS